MKHQTEEEKKKAARGVCSYAVKKRMGVTGNREGGTPARGGSFTDLRCRIF